MKIGHDFHFGTCVHWSFSLSRRPFSLSNISWLATTGVTTSGDDLAGPNLGLMSKIHRCWVQGILEKDGKGYIEMFSRCSYITSSGFGTPKTLWHYVTDVWQFDHICQDFSHRSCSGTMYHNDNSPEFIQGYPRCGIQGSFPSDLLHVIYLSKFLSNLSTPSI